MSRHPEPAAHHEAGQRAAWVGGAITIAMGLLVQNAAALAATGVVLLLAGWFALDAVRYIVRGLKGDYTGRAIDWALPALGNLAVAVGIQLATCVVVASMRQTITW